MTDLNCPVESLCELFNMLHSYPMPAFGAPAGYGFAPSGGSHAYPEAVGFGSFPFVRLVCE
jgi:hypothetical protein